ncbi:MAG TPA: alpha/beta hydrolase-fold protein [Xanthomonadales bacterium]|nr:alpha/beta hydrolase-fold protein [Xanthomonadales bacterium]
MLKTTSKTLVLLAFFAITEIAGAGQLSDNIRISSKYMGYDLQYRVFTPDGIESDGRYPVLLVTDGAMYIQMGMPQVVDELVAAGAIRPVFVVFVDSRNPDNLDESRRNSEFMCKIEYVNFFNAELLQELYKNYPISADRDDTNILGLSFGGLNSACFGVITSKTFSGIGMHSPASDKHVREVSKLYQRNETQPLRIFISSGTRNDNLRSTRRFRDVLEEEGYEVTYVENKGAAHNYENWIELLDDALITLVPAE